MKFNQSLSPYRSQSDYLPHLDGLRAIALTGVLLFHFRPRDYVGGYVGVDSFLCLSGFLITRNIFRQLSDHSFSFSSFYTSRFFRLYPASVVTILFTLMMAFLTIPPDTFSSVAKSSISGMFFFSNVYFNLQANYFDPGKFSKPLLHFWSLSLEEQFYFVWAPLIVLVNQTTSRSAVFIVILVVLFVVSFTAGLLLDASHSSLVFFQLPFRIWQFSAGALIAVVANIINKNSITAEVNLPYHRRQMKQLTEYGHEEQIPDTKVVIHDPSSTLSLDTEKSHSSGSNRTENENVLQSNTPPPEDETYISPPSTTENLVRFIKLLSAETACIIAFAGLLYSFKYLPPDAPMHKLLQPTLCTCIMISMKQTFFSRYILSFPLLSAVGRLTYSAYLVHWPLYVFMVRTCGGLRIPRPPTVAMTVGTFVIAVILRRFVEDPVRRGKHRVSLAILSFITLSFAIIIILTDGLPFRVAAPSTEITLRTHRLLFKETCIKVPKSDSRFKDLDKLSNPCVVGDISGEYGQIFFHWRFFHHASCSWVC